MNTNEEKEVLTGGNGAEADRIMAGQNHGETVQTSNLQKIDKETEASTLTEGNTETKAGSFSSLPSFSSVKTRHSLQKETNETKARTLFIKGLRRAASSAQCRPRA
jgi:hypothetical protein